MNTNTYLSQWMRIDIRMTLVRLFITIVITMLKLHLNSEVEATSQTYAYTHIPTSSIECLMYGETKTRSKLECVVNCQKQHYPMKLAGFTYNSDGICYCLPVVTPLDHQAALESRAFIVGTTAVIPGESVSEAILAIDLNDILLELVQP